QSLWVDYTRCDREGTFDEVRDAQRGVDRTLVDWLDGSVDIDAECRIQRRDRVQVDTRANVLLHLFEHQLHHRGQVHAMLSGTDVKPPQLDEFFLADELPLREAELRELGLPVR